MDSFLGMRPVRGGLPRLRSPFADQQDGIPRKRPVAGGGSPAVAGTGGRSQAGRRTAAAVGCARRSRPAGNLACCLA